MLNRTELKAWTDALRSGNYVQSKEFFKKRDISGGFCFCAIGILCEINGFKGKERGDIYTFVTKDVEDFLDNNKLSADEDYGVFQLLGMPNLLGYKTIAEANDEGVSFKEIADHLDKYYPAIEG